MSCSMLLLNLLDCADNQALVLHFHAVLPAVLMTEVLGDGKHLLRNSFVS